MALHLPKNVLKEVEYNISSLTPVRECLSVLKGEMSDDSYGCILASLNQGFKNVFFDTIGCEKSLFIRFVAVMHKLNKDIYDILMKAIRSYCAKKDLSQVLTDYEQLIAKEVKKLERQGHEEEQESTDDSVSTSVPTSTPSSSMTTLTTVSTLLPATFQASGSNSDIAYVPSTSSPTVPVQVPSNTPSSSGAVQSPIPPRSTMPAPIERIASMPNLSHAQPPLNNQGIRKLHGYKIRRLQKELQDTCTGEGEGHFRMWQVLLERGEFPISLDREEEIERSDKQGKEFFDALSESGMTIGQLEQHFRHVQFQVGLDIIRGDPAGQQQAVTSPGGHNRAQLPLDQSSLGQSTPTAGQQQAVTSPGGHNRAQLPLDQSSIGQSIPTAGQQPAMIFYSPGAHSREQVPPDQYTLGHSTPTAGQQQAMTSPSAHSQVHLDQPSFGHNTLTGVSRQQQWPSDLSGIRNDGGTAGQQQAMPSPGAHSHVQFDQPSIGHITPTGVSRQQQWPSEQSGIRNNNITGPASQPPVSDAAVGDETSLKGSRCVGLVEDPARPLGDNIQEREADSFRTSGPRSLPPPAYAQASDSSSGFTRMDSRSQQSFDGNTPSLERLIQSVPRKIPVLRHEAGPAATNFAEVATESEETQKPIETRNTGIPERERRPGNDDPPPYSEACDPQNRTSSRASE